MYKISIAGYWTDSDDPEQSTPTHAHAIGVVVASRGDRCGQPHPKERTGLEKPSICTSDSASRYCSNPARPFCPSTPLLGVSGRLVFPDVRRMSNARAMPFFSSGGGRSGGHVEVCVEICSFVERATNTGSRLSETRQIERRRVDKGRGTEKWPGNESASDDAREAGFTRSLNMAHGCFLSQVMTWSYPDKMSPPMLWCSRTPCKKDTRPPRSRWSPRTPLMGQSASTPREKPTTVSCVRSSI